jgi:thiol-disulfide isomerase/thioredoxin
MLKRCFAAGLVLMVAGTAFAQNEKPAKPEKTTEKQPEIKALKLGDRAPQLTIEKWVKGEPVTGFEKGKVYVVEFWATWCGPCVASMPHMTELQSKYKSKGVTIIGVSSTDTRGNTLEKVEKMVKDKGDDKMGYSVAWDKERSTNEAYMKAAGQGGIPCAFLINQEGKVAYIGHPHYLDEPLEKVVAGKWDIEAGNKAIKDKQEQEAKEQQKQAEKQEANLKIVEEYKALLEDGKTDAAYQKVRDRVDSDFKDDAQSLNAVAWFLVDPQIKVAKPDLDLALKAAKRAVELTEESRPDILDTYALVVFRRGDAKRALELEKKAISLLPEGMPATARKEYEDRLKEFQNAVDKK